MIVPVKSHAAGAQSFRRTRRRSRTIQARAEIEGRPFSRISETYVGITHACRRSRAGLRRRRADEQIWHAQIHRKVFIENVAHRRVDIGDKPIGIAAAFIGLRPGEALLVSRSLGCYWRHGLSRRGYRKQE